MVREEDPDCGWIYFSGTRRAWLLDNVKKGARQRAEKEKPAKLALARSTVG